MGKPRRNFTPEFKQEAVDLCRRSGKSECQVARELGIPQPTFNQWMRQVAGAPRGSNFCAILLSSLCECAERSVPLGKYCRRSLFVFSLVPRCQGLWGSQKYT